MRVTVLNLGQLEYSRQIPGPVRNGRSDVLTGPKISIRPVLDLSERFDDERPHRDRDGLSCLCRPNEHFSVGHVALRQSDRITDSQAGVAHSQHERLMRSWLPSYLPQAAKMLSSRLVKRQRRTLRHLWWLHGEGWILLDPSSLVAEAEERPHALQILGRVERAVAPRLPKLAQRIDRDLPEVVESLPLGPWNEAILEQMPVLARRVPPSLRASQSSKNLPTASRVVGASIFTTPISPATVQELISSVAASHEV